MYHARFFMETEDGAETEKGKDKARFPLAVVPPKLGGRVSQPSMSTFLFDFNT